MTRPLGIGCATRPQQSRHKCEALWLSVYTWQMVMQITLADKQARIINDPPSPPAHVVVVVSFVADDVDAVVHNYHRLAAIGSKADRPCA